MQVHNNFSVFNVADRNFNIRLAWCGTMHSAQWWVRPQFAMLRCKCINKIAHFPLNAFRVCQISVPYPCTNFIVTLRSVAIQLLEEIAAFRFPHNNVLFNCQLKIFESQHSPLVDFIVYELPMFWNTIFSPITIIDSTSASPTPPFIHRTKKKNSSNE